METLFSDKFNDIYYNPTNGIHYHITKPETIRMTEPEFKEMVLNWKKVMLEVTPQFILIDNRDFQFPITPDLQTWIAQNVSIPVLSQASVKKSCFVLPKEFIAQLSVSQLTEEAKNAAQGEVVRYFSDKKEAEEWLTNDESA